MYLFDPRENKIINSDNPALLFADIMIKQFSDNFKIDNRFWVLVSDLANICDGKNHNSRKVSICKNEEHEYQIFVDKVDDTLKEEMIKRKKEKNKGIKKIPLKLKLNGKKKKKNMV